MWQRKCQFTVRDGRGRNVIVNVYAVPGGGPDTLMTAEGDLVQHLRDGQYAVLDTGEILRTDPVGQAPLA
jgi:hypothetical protein